MSDIIWLMSSNSHGPFANQMPIVLASGSPRRRELLTGLGLEFEVRPSLLDEPDPMPRENPIDYAARMATMKAMDVAGQEQGAAVIGADTIVTLDDRVMGKPTDDEDALAMLKRLSGRTHQVITAFCVAREGESQTQSVVTDVEMRISGEAELRNYVASGEPMDKAGAYGIQGVGRFMVKAIRGSYTNVVGLPVSRVLETLLRNDIAKPRD